MAEPVVKLERVGKSYGEIRILRDLSLEVKDGDSLAIVGPSGSGKSTLLHIVGALDHPTTGAVFFDGRGLNGMDETELAALRSRSIGFVFQAHHLLSHLTVLENVLVPVLANSRRAGPEAVERGKRLLDRVGLGAQLEQCASRLSGGESQRVALVRALINNPRLLLADEPTGSLDQASSASIADLICSLNTERKLAMIVVTHSLDLAKRMQRVLVLRDGNLAPLP